MQANWQSLVTMKVMLFAKPDCQDSVFFVIKLIINANCHQCIHYNNQLCMYANNHFCIPHYMFLRIQFGRN